MTGVGDIVESDVVSDLARTTQPCSTARRESSHLAELHL